MKQLSRLHDSAFLDDLFLQGLLKSFGNLWTTARLLGLVPLSDALNITKSLHPHRNLPALFLLAHLRFSTLGAASTTGEVTTFLANSPCYFKMNITSEEPVPFRGWPAAHSHHMCVCETCSREHSASTHKRRTACRQIWLFLCELPPVFPQGPSSTLRNLLAHQILNTRLREDMVNPCPGRHKSPLRRAPRAQCASGNSPSSVRVTWHSRVLLTSDRAVTCRSSARFRKNPGMIGQREIRPPRRPWRAKIIMNRWQNERVYVKVHGFCRTALKLTFPRKATVCRCCGIER